MTAVDTRRRIMALFRARIRRWREDKPSGLAVIDIPRDLVTELGGRRQMRVAGSLSGVPFTGSTMLVAGGGFLRWREPCRTPSLDVQLERANAAPA
jgi:hypothetical protein